VRNVAAVSYDPPVLVGALEANRVANLGLMLVAGLLIVAVVIALLVRAVVAKVVIALGLVVLGLVVWSQRSSLQDCANQVKAAASGGASTKQCRFLGIKVDVTPTNG
jgi:Flp pilus assembly protein TadB